MPHKAVWKQKGVIWQFEGEVDFEEVQQVHHEFFSTPRSDHIHYQIFDTLQISKSMLSEYQAKMAAAFDLGGSRSIQKMKVAIVANSEEIESHSNIYATKLDDSKSTWKVRVFDNLSDAEAWCLSQS